MVVYLHPLIIKKPAAFDGWESALCQMHIISFVGGCVKCFGSYRVQTRHKKGHLLVASFFCKEVTINNVTEQDKK